MHLPSVYCSVIYSSWDMKETQLSADGGLDKGDVVRGIQCSITQLWKEQNCVICRDMDEPGDCHREWAKSEREKQTMYIHAYM